MDSLPGSLRRVLELFERSSKSLTIDEVAAALGIKTTTARKYLDQLVRLGYLTRDNGVYSLVIAKESKVSEQKLDVETASKAGGDYKETSGNVSEAKGSEEVLYRSVPPEAAFYFYRYGGTPLVLGVRSLEQLWAAVKYGLVDPDTLAYNIRYGYLQAWIERVLGLKEIADKIDGLRTIESENLSKSLIELLENVLNCGDKKQFT